MQTFPNGQDDWKTDYSAVLPGPTGAAVLFDQSARGRIEAVGNDAAVFLHNLCSNDIKGLGPNNGCEAFFCTSTAKVVGHGMIWRHPPEGKRERLMLDFPPGFGGKMLGHLDRYLISEDVTLTDISTSRVQYHLAGPGAIEVLGALWEGPWVLGAMRSTAGVDVRCTDPLGVPGFDLVGTSETLAPLLATGVRPGCARAFETLRIEAGTVLFGTDMDESTFAPETNRTSRAISYNKGCYLGQEPIVMARDRGAAPRIYVGLHCGTEPLPPGTSLVRDGKDVGKTMSSTVSPRLGSAIALACVKRICQTPGTELQAAGRAVRVVQLPFVA